MQEELEEYLLSHIDPEPEWLRRLDRDAHVQMINPRMNSGHLQGRLLKMIAAMIAPRCILEIGTFGGYSALCLAEGALHATVVTIEIDDEREDFIREHLDMAPCGDRVDLRIGDAMEVLPGLRKEFGDGSFDMVFMDADKRTYSQCLEHVVPLVRKGGFILADNVLWSGHVADPAYSRDRQTRGIDRFNESVHNDPRFECVILPVRDGISILRRL